MTQSAAVRCAAHPEADALGRCLRCDAAMCAACLESGRLCQACARKQRALALPLSLIATRALRIALWINLGMAMLGVATFIDLRAVAPHLGQPDVDPTRLAGANLELSALIPGQRLALVLLLLCACFWFFRMHRSLAPGRRFRFPAHGYLLLLVPGVNLVAPYFMLAELVRPGRDGPGGLRRLRLAWPLTAFSMLAMTWAGLAFRMGGRGPALMYMADVNLLAEGLFSASMLALRPVVSAVRDNLELTAVEPRK